MLNKPLLKALTYSAGCLTIMLGIAVIIGWHWHDLFIIQISPEWIPMQYNTAICFVLGGLALVALNGGAIRTCRALNFFLLLLSGLTFLQYALNHSFGIDQLFIQPFMATFTDYPGRMALNPSLSFLFIGFTFWLLTITYRVNKKKIESAINVILLSLIIIAIINLTAALRMHHGIAEAMKMPFNALIGFIILSLGLVSFIYRDREEREAILIVPLLITFIFLFFTIWSWQSIIKNQYDYLNKLLQLKLQGISTYIHMSMQERATSFSRITYRWINRLNTPEKEWRSDVSHYIEDQPGYVAMEWIDKKYFIRWVEPQRGNEKVQDFNLLQDKEKRNVMEKAIATKQLQMSPVMNLIQGGKGILLFSPIFKNDQFEGLIGGVINTQIMLSQLVPTQFVNGYGLKIYSRGRLLYASKNNVSNMHKTWVRQIDLPILGQIWQVEIWPSEELFQQIMSSWLPLGTLIVGIFISILAGLLLRTLHLVRIGSARLNDIRLELADTNERLNGILEGSIDLIAALDLNYNFIAYNTAYKNEVYRMFKVNLEKGMNFNVLLQRMDPENQQKTLALWNKAFKGQSFSVIESFKDKRFRGLDYEVHFNPIRNAQGKLVGASHTSTNVFYRMQSEKKLIESKKELERLVLSLEKQNKELGLLEEMMNLLQSSNSLEEMIQPLSTYIKIILTSTAGVIYFVDKDDRNLLKETLSWCNPVAHHTQILRSDCEALMRNKMHHVTVGQDDSICKHAIANGGPYICQPLYVQGVMLGLVYIEIDIEDSANKRLVYLSQILSEQIGLSLYNIKLRDELRLQSTHDALTGLYNRRFFESYLEKEFLRAERNPIFFSILLIDIDYFKTINDNYGHLMGDKVLQLVAIELARHCRKSDVLCRWGGEEFVMFLSDTSLEHIKPKAESIRQALQQLSVSINGLNLKQITISIGVALYPYCGKDLDGLIAKADEALYQAKTRGRNRVVICEQ